MVLNCNDFTYNKKSLINDFSHKYIIVGKEGDTDNISLAMNRQAEASARNRYRNKTNFFGTSNTEFLNFNISIMKNICTYDNQKDLIFTKSEIRELTSWLMELTYPSWLETDYSAVEDIRYLGVFLNVDTYVVEGNIVGLIFSFESNSSYGYTYDKTNSKTISKLDSILVVNSSDTLGEYLYPRIIIESAVRTDVFLHNKDDSLIVDNGRIAIIEGEPSIDRLNKLKEKIGEYALTHNLTVEYVEDDSFCNNIGTEFYMTNIKLERVKYYAYYDQNGDYIIFTRGMLLMNTLADNSIYIDCQKLTIKDSIGRMIQYEDLGIENIDSIYWFRLVNGENNIIVCGENTTIQFIHNEERIGV